MRAARKGDAREKGTGFFFLLHPSRGPAVRRTKKIPVPFSFLAIALLALFTVDRARAIDESDWQRAEEVLRGRVPADFPVVRSDPFLVTGDIGGADVRRLVERTIGPCTRALYHDFFEKQPDFVITIFLFGDDTSYRTWSKKLFGREPTTKFGYYLHTEQALVMNIATGSGTLVHEMVPPLMAVDFPQSPTWFNEGMGSLFEQCRIREGPSLSGLVNWRLPILQRAVGTEKYISLDELLATGRQEFYGPNQGVHYAEARYLLMYAQERGLLKGLYPHFRSHVREDPTGRLSLEETFGKGLSEVESDWLAWTKTLRWPPVSQP